MGLQCRVSVSARSRGLPWRAPAAQMELRREQLLSQLAGWCELLTKKVKKCSTFMSYQEK